MQNKIGLASASSSLKSKMRVETRAGRWNKSRLLWMALLFRLLGEPRRRYYERAKNFEQSKSKGRHPLPFQFYPLHSDLQPWLFSVHFFYHRGYNEESMRKIVAIWHQLSKEVLDRRSSLWLVFADQMGFFNCNDVDVWAWQMDCSKCVRLVCPCATSPWHVTSDPWARATSRLACS